MKTLIFALLLFAAASAYAVPPLVQSLPAPSCDITRAVHIANTEAQKIDLRYYCASAEYIQASLIVKEGEVDVGPRHWRLTFSIPGDDLRKGTSKDLLILISSDGKTWRVFRTPSEAKYRA